ncbi:MAG: nucleotide-binding protein, partial [Candidatus Heimdallarchaeaceae archaeon]
KGGTGKTLIATSLALSKEGAHLLDADVEEPNCSLFLDLEIKKVATATVPIPDIDTDICTLCGKCSDSCEYNALANLPGQILLFDKICHGCGVCSFVCPENAITEVDKPLGYIYKGKNEHLTFHYGELIVGEELATPIISRLMKTIDKNDKIVIIDSPPGSACPMVEAIHGSDFVILAGEPTPFGLSDMKIVVETLRKLGTKFGVVINKDGVGNDELESYCEEDEIPILMKIPFDMEIAKQNSEGIPLVKGFPEYESKFQNLYSNIEEMVKNE